MLRRAVYALTPPNFTLSAPDIAHWNRPEPPRWGTAVSAWGDTFVACGTALELLERTGATDLGMVYYGGQNEIPDFLRAQRWCREVAWVRPADGAELWRVICASSSGHRRETWLPTLLGDTGIDPETVCPTHLSIHLDQPQPFRMWKPRLPTSAWKAARKLICGTGAAFLLHPWSFQSAQIQHHFPHWPALVRRVLDETPYTYVLTGVGYDPAPFGTHPRLLNLHGRTTSLEALALATLLPPICTGNSVACWSAMTGVRAFVLFNSGIPNAQNLFHRWIAQPHVTWLRWNVSLEVAWVRLRDWMAASARPCPNRGEGTVLAAG